MTEEELKGITDSIKEKLGEESTALIADDLGILFTKNTEVQNNMTKQDEEISSLKSTNEKLVLANGRLLQQVPMGTNKKVEQEKDDSVKKSFNFSQMFDKSGNFKHDI